MQFKLFALTAAVTISARETCEWTAGVSGAQQACLPGYYMKGICGSGLRATCHTGLSPLAPKHDFQVNCCTDTRAAYTPGTCGEFVTGSSDTGAVCNTFETVFGVCLSNARGECEAARSALPKAYAMQCCANDGSMNVDYESCDWKYGGDGDNIDCGSNTILAGICGSGNGEDCATAGNSTAAFGAYCCPWN